MPNTPPSPFSWRSFLSEGNSSSRKRNAEVVELDNPPVSKSKRFQAVNSNTHSESTSEPRVVNSSLMPTDNNFPQAQLPDELPDGISQSPSFKKLGEDMWNAVFGGGRSNEATALSPEELSERMAILISEAIQRIQAEISNKYVKFDDKFQSVCESLLHEGFTERQLVDIYNWRGAGAVNEMKDSYLTLKEYGFTAIQIAAIARFGGARTLNSILTHRDALRGYGCNVEYISKLAGEFHSSSYGTSRIICFLKKAAKFEKETGCELDDMFRQIFISENNAVKPSVEAEKYIAEKKRLLLAPLPRNREAISPHLGE